MINREGGHDACKKWKTSVRVLLPDGEIGETVGTWLEVSTPFRGLSLES